MLFNMLSFNMFILSMFLMKVFKTNLALNLEIFKIFMELFDMPIEIWLVLNLNSTVLLFEFYILKIIFIMDSKSYYKQK